jgi:hypothetical protein
MGLLVIIVRNLAKLMEYNLNPKSTIGDHVRVARRLGGYFMMYITVNILGACEGT